ncbi:hypothetical protein Acy02nite_51920 [Actinoplanes cyaneus]|uniref:Uncharacterized protein n=1 Tax=Actinoplanes cyaneus TaxID=52696 RepID=A0A919MDM4_9ACTN|nr:hypothetical protein Acy02nite_51920 [Actinoplanes cyaneus]
MVLMESMRRLDVPALAVTTGGPEVEWVELPVVGDGSIRSLFSRLPGLRLRVPLDPRSAQRARRFLWHRAGKLVVSLVVCAALFAGFFAAPTGPRRLLIALVIVAVLAVLLVPAINGALPRQTPRRAGPAVVCLPDVLAEVAEQWAARNPGVISLHVRAPLRHSRRFYLTWSAILAGAGIALGLLAMSLGWGSVGFPMMVLLFCANRVAAKLLPPAYVRAVTST